MTQQEFIEKIAPLCQKYSRQYGFKVASPAIAQACLESTYGTSPKAQFHNYFGLKFRANRVKCNNGFFEAGGSEQNPNGTYVQLPTTTAWYNFDDMEHGVEGYYQFLQDSRYDRVRTAETPLKYLQEIKNAGYATSLDYVQNVYKVIQKWNLTKYDAEDANESSANNAETTIQIVKQTSSHNTSSKPNRNINWIVLHYTAGTTSIRGAARNTANYFQRATVQASADFIVDDAEIVQYNPDPKNLYCWAVGGKKYSNQVNSIAGTLYGQCQNNNSISIEMCSRKRNTSSLAVTDDDWYITDATINNTVKLTKYLIKLYNVDIKHVIMHCHVTGKWCPQPWVKNETALSEWRKFLAKVSGAGTTTSSNTINNNQNVVPAAYLVRVTADTLNVREGPGTMYKIVTSIHKSSIYTIVEEKNGWGCLKSGVGWICLAYTEKYSGG